MGKRSKLPAPPPATPAVSYRWLRLRLVVSLVVGALITIAAIATSEYRWMARREVALVPVGVRIHRIETASSRKLPPGKQHDDRDTSILDMFWRRFRAVDDLSLASAAWKQEAAKIAQQIEGDENAVVLVEQVKSPKLPPVHRFIIIRANDPSQLTEQLEQLNIAATKEQKADERTYYLVSPTTSPQWQPYDALFEERVRILNDIDKTIAKKREELKKLEQSAPPPLVQPQESTTKVVTETGATKVPPVVVASSASTEPKGVSAIWLEYRLPIVVGLIYYLVILLGIEAGSLYEVVSQRKSNARLRFRDVVAYSLSVQHWQGVLVSPLIFGVFYVGIAGDGLRVSFLVFALQNGFFWRTLMKRLQIRSEANREVQLS